jgi:hypothetical protein
MKPKPIFIKVASTADMDALMHTEFPEGTVFLLDGVDVVEAGIVVKWAWLAVGLLVGLGLGVFL